MFNFRLDFRRRHIQNYFLSDNHGNRVLFVVAVFEKIVGKMKYTVHKRFYREVNYILNVSVF